MFIDIFVFIVTEPRFDTNLTKSLVWCLVCSFSVAVIHKALRVMLSAKFTQDQIKVVDNFNIRSHKTKHAVRALRRIVGEW